MGDVIKLIVPYDSKIDNCRFIKVVLMISVVLYHSSVFWTGAWMDVISVYEKSSFLDIFSKWLNSFHVYGFTLVSGYIFNYLIDEGKYRNFTKFILKKLNRLIVPYVFVALIWVAPISSIVLSLDKIELFYKYVLCINPSQLWFLWMLFNVFIISWCLKKYIRNNLYALIICLLSYAIGLIGGKFINNFFCIWTSLRFLTYFIIGMKINEKDDSCFLKISPLFFLVAHLASFLIVNLLSKYDGVLISVLTIGFGYVMNIMGALMSFTVLSSLSEKFAWESNRLFNDLSRRTMIIYLFHQQIIYFTIILFNGRVSPILNMLINFVVAMIISYIISYILLKFKVTRKLVGENY